MLDPGEYRRQISIELNAAYGDGLLSERTLTYRLELLLGSRLLDPDRLIGDLSFRASSRSLKQTLGRGVDALRDTFHRRPRPTGVATLVLALDWADADPDELLVGRHPDCDVVLEHPSVSRKHALLTYRDGNWILRDLESTNGTEVNGATVRRCQLRPGDRVSLGRQAVVVD